MILVANSRDVRKNLMIFFFCLVKVVFVLASNHFWKCFSVNAGVWLCMENKFSRKYFQLTKCFNGFDLEIGFSQNFHFKPFPNSRTKREREERAQITPSTLLANPEPRSRHEPFPLLTQHGLSSLTTTHSSDRAPVRRPQIELQSDDPHSTGLVYRSTVSIAPDWPVSSIAALHRSSKDRLQRHSISPPPRDLTSRLNPVASLSSFSQFDQIWWIFFLGFVSFVGLFGWWKNVSVELGWISHLMQWNG